MAQARLAPLPALQPVAPYALAIDAFVDATTHRFATTLLAALTGFVEPATIEPDRARRLVGYTVETLAGFARGAAIAPLARLVRRHADAAGRTALRHLLASGVVSASTTTGRAPILVPVLADADRRPLVDDLGAHLHLRLATDAAELRAIARRLVAVAPGARADQIAALGDDDHAALRFGDQLVHGWDTVRAAIGTLDAPRIDHAPSRDLWHHWLRAVRGERPSSPSAARIGDGPLTRIG